MVWFPRLAVAKRLFSSEGMTEEKAHKQTFHGIVPGFSGDFGLCVALMRGINEGRDSQINWGPGEGARDQ